MNDGAKLLALAVLLGGSLWNVKRIVEKNLPDVKEGANLDDLEPVMDKALLAVRSAATELGGPAVITSGLDGVHSHGSLHYVGKAVDARRVDWPEFNDVDLAARQRTLIANQIGDDFDVIVEPTHIHIEYDPKRV